MQPAFVVSSGPRSGLKSQSWNLDAVCVTRYCEIFTFDASLTTVGRRAVSRSANLIFGVSPPLAVHRSRSGHQLGNRLPVREFCCFPASGKGESRK